MGAIMEEDVTADAGRRIATTPRARRYGMATPQVGERLAGMVDRFTTTLDCVVTTYIGDELLDQLPAPAQLGATRVGGVDLNKPRIRTSAHRRTELPGDTHEGPGC